MNNRPQSGDLNADETAEYKRFKRRLMLFRIVAVLIVVAVFCTSFGRGAAEILQRLVITCVTLWFVNVWFGSFDPRIKKDDVVILVSPEEEEPSPELKKLKEFATATGKHPFEAYMAVYSAVWFNPETKQFEQPAGHISAAELTKRFVRMVELAHQTDMGRVLSEWRISRPENIGEMVFEMIELGVIAKKPEDKQSDFSELPSFSDLRGLND